VRKLAVKPDSPYYDWLERELAHRFDVACCATHEQFRRETKAITRAGQIKAPGERHEKDDRHRLDDRSRYVLGWTNAAKIRRPRSQCAATRNYGSAELGSRIGKILGEQNALKERLTALSKLGEYGDFSEFSELDWQSSGQRSGKPAGRKALARSDLRRAAEPRPFA
jgi:uncharacterized protein YPO0396